MNTTTPHSSPSVGDLPWYVAYAKPHQEKTAVQNLERQSFKTLMPLYKRIKLVRTKWVEVYEPMFPRYVFFQQAHQEHSLSPVRSTLGILRMVKFGDTPATLSPASLANLLALIDAHNQEKYERLSPIKEGKTVEVHHGAFVGLRGLVSSVSQERVTVLLDILGQQQEIDFEPSILRPFEA